mmetsp:Transcript_3613/g.10404  ORF Transcript_3613/g.10404 Transcript_3613/m.10404 type:complete len:682 (-) Transcript_3613:1758-3803(-)
MADDFEKAILFSFDQTGSVDVALKQRAQAYCEDFKRRPDNWVACIEHFSGTQYSEVKFWCLQTMLETVKTYYHSMAISSRAQIKQALLKWMSEETSLASFLKNKLAQILVYIVQVEYPEQWPSFFQDLLALIHNGPHVVEMFCRILTAIDDDVISLDIPRSQEESRRSMHVKDAMRELCIQELAEAWYHLVSMYKDSQPMLAAMVLDSAKRYISWIDINLVANDRFVPLLFTLPSSPSEPLQASACGCIIEILAKRMEALYKLQLIQQLGIVPVCKSWVGGMPRLGADADPDPDLAERYATLLSTLANELLDCWKRAENGVMSIAAVGLTVDPEAVKEAQEATTTALGLLSDLFPAVISALHSPVDGVAMAMVPFLLAYMQRLKRLSGLSEQHLQHSRLTLEGLSRCAMYPLDMPEDTCGGETGAMIEEIEETVAGKRREAFTLFRNIAKISLPDTAAFVGSRLEGVIASPQASFQVMCLFLFPPLPPFIRHGLCLPCACSLNFRHSGHLSALFGSAGGGNRCDSPLPAWGGGHRGVHQARLWTAWTNGCSIDAGWRTATPCPAPAGGSGSSGNLCQILQSDPSSPDTCASSARCPSRRSGDGTQLHRCVYPGVLPLSAAGEAASEQPGTHAGDYSFGAGAAFVQDCFHSSFSGGGTRWPGTGWPQGHSWKRSNRSSFLSG